MTGRISLVILLVALFPAVAWGQEPVNRGVCTADNQAARQRLESVLTDPNLADVLAKAGLKAADPADARILQHPFGSNICAKLQQRVPRPYNIRGPHAAWTPTYFRLGDRYIVTLVLNPDVDLHERVPAWGQTIILTLDYDIVETILD